jgi:hypothetical protein
LKQEPIFRSCFSQLFFAAVFPRNSPRNIAAMNWGELVD